DFLRPRARMELLNSADNQRHTHQREENDPANFVRWLLINRDGQKDRDRLQPSRPVGAIFLTRWECDEKSCCRKESKAKECSDRVGPSGLGPTGRDVTSFAQRNYGEMTRTPVIPVPLRGPVVAVSWML